jgi:hypothetical protein
LSFTRASNGTRINSAGLVEVCPWNLITYSEEFNNGSKALVNATIGVDVTTAPNGTTTADSLIENGANDLHAVYNFGALTYVAGIYNLSCYVKKGIRDWVRVQLYDGTNNQSVWANVNTGVLGTVVSPATATIESVGDGWYRISISTTMLSASGGWAIYSSTDDAQFGGYQGTNGATALYLWGLQINIGSTAKPYFPTTDRLNVPRLTYQNGGGGCPSLLLEKQSTNLVTYSEDFSNAAWLLANGGGTASGSVTSNYGISPDGTQNADRIQLNKGNTGYSEIYQLFSTTIGSTYTQTLWLKSLSGTPKINFGYTGSTRGTITLTTEWKRYEFTYVSGGNPNGVALTLYDGFDPSTAQSIDVLAWGAQAELSSYPTSYIPTTSSSATRVADACFKTGISSLIGQTEGVLFADFYYDLGINTPNGSDKSIMVIRPNGGSYNNEIALIYYGDEGGAYGKTIQVVVVVGGVVQCSLKTPQTLTSGYYKVAFAYKQNDFAFYVNGTQIGTHSSGSVPTCDELYLSDPLRTTNHKTSEAVLFKTRLTNAELASLTTI